jgi:bifunctional non-homologous end joining protein LigD
MKLQSGLKKRSRTNNQRLASRSTSSEVLIDGHKSQILLKPGYEQRLEGIVAKRANSGYQTGVRSRDWIKVKFTQTGNFVVVGYKAGDGFLVAESHPDGFHIVGIVQFGFSNNDYKRLVDLLKPTVLQPQSRKERDVLWLEPTVIVNIEFMEWTSRRLLRFPVFRGFAERI